MKRTNILYWIFTGLFGAYMIFTAIPDALATEDAIKLVHDTLGYPVYFISFIGIAKILGAITILLPGFKRIKEWAYAGLMFDLVGATYSLMMVAPQIMTLIVMLLPIIVGGLSYIYLHKRSKAQ